MTMKVFTDISDSETTFSGRTCERSLVSDYPNHTIERRQNEQVRPRASQVYNLRTTVSVLLESRALEAVESITDPLAATYDALILIVAERALVADADERRGTDVGIADGAFAVAFVA